MPQVAYTPTFLKQLKKLEKGLQKEAIEKIQIFSDDSKNPLLKTHKLKGSLAGRLSFSVNYKTRIVFRFLSPKEAVLLAIGDHDVYK